MAVETKNLCSHLHGLMHDTTPRSEGFVHGERALVITALVLLIVAALAFGKVGAFASFDSSSIVGFSCLGGIALIALIKGFFLSLPCCSSYLVSHARDSGSWVQAKTVTFTDEDRKNAKGL